MSQGINVLIKDDMAIAGLLLFLPGLAFWLTKKYKWAQYISAAGLCYLFGILLSNFHIIPPEHNLYDLVSTYGLYMALSMILLTVNFKNWLKAGKSSLIALAAAFVVVFVISVISGIFFAPKVDPQHGWKLTGMLIGTYTGGSMNLAAVGKALNTPSNLFVATNAVDIVFGTLFLPLQLLVIPLMEKMKIRKLSLEELMGTGSAEETERVKKEGYWYKKSWNYYDFVYTVSIAGLIMGISHFISTAINFGMWKGTVNILLLSTLSLIAGSIKTVNNLVGGEEVGMYLLHVFFLALGATCYIPTLLKASPYIIVWIVLVIYLSGLLHFLISSYILKIDYQSIWVAAQASIGGPSTAMALAITAQWPALAVSGAICGLIGYAAGNYLGVTGAYLVFKIVH